MTTVDEWLRAAEHWARKRADDAARDLATARKLALAFPTSTRRRGAWDHTQWGTPADPIRQSALNAIAGQDGCAKRYFYDRDADARGVPRARALDWRPIMGTAIHGAIESALAADAPPLSSLDLLLGQLDRAADGDANSIAWHDANRATEIAHALAMIQHALREVSRRARTVIAVEAPFVAELDGYTLTGTLDLVYQRDDGGLVIADWKTGSRRVCDVLLDHGYQVAVYSYALEHGTLWPDDPTRATRIGVAPEDVYIVHLRDYADHALTVELLSMLREHGPVTARELADCIAARGLPLSPASVSSRLSTLRRDGFADYVRKGRSVAWTVTGDAVPPPPSTAWRASQRRPGDLARLRESLRTVVASVRGGHALERLGEQCGRCHWRNECLGIEEFDGARAVAKWSETATEDEESEQ